jgi:hypothetical protein
LLRLPHTRVEWGGEKGVRWDLPNHVTNVKGIGMIGKAFWGSHDQTKAARQRPEPTRAIRKTAPSSLRELDVRMSRPRGNWSSEVSQDRPTHGSEA